MVLKTIQSNLSKNKVAKLYYVVRIFNQIIHNNGHYSKYVKKLHIPNSPEFKFIDYDLHSLPPSLKPSEPIDISATRYLNKSQVPIANLLKQPLHIKLYNKQWFNKPLNNEK